MSELTSRERMRRALNLEATDHVPCCFMSFSALRQRYNEDRYQVVKAQRAMGLDALLFIPAASRAQRPEHPDLRGLPLRFAPQVEIRQWREHVPGSLDLLHKEYATPDGTLTTTVRLSRDWPHGNHIPFVDDYQIPRTENPLVTGPQDLAALRHLLVPPHADDVAAFRHEVQQALAFSAEHGVLLVGGWGVGMDMANWLCGMQNLMIAMLQQPGFVIELLDLIHAWNMQRMQVVLSAPVDLYVRRAWYEGCDFVTPAFFQEALLPRLKTEIRLAHSYGARFGYICSSGLNPMLEYYLDAGIDVLIGIDPVQGAQTDMHLLKQKLGAKVCLWGGVSGAVTVEMGTEPEVRSAVREALQALGPIGHILSPVDNITIDAQRTWRNIEIFIEEWRQHW